MMGNTVIEAAVPVNGLYPAEATQAAPIRAIEAECVGLSAPFIMSTMLWATALPIMADGMPVRGGAGVMEVPRGLTRGRETWCGGANAIPAANRFGYAGL
jgi:hypothetical protein